MLQHDRRREDAAAAGTAAGALYERKGNLVGASKARSLVDLLETATVSSRR